MYRKTKERNPSCLLISGLWVFKKFFILLYTSKFSTISTLHSIVRDKSCKNKIKKPTTHKKMPLRCLSENYSFLWTTLMLKHLPQQTESFDFSSYGPEQTAEKIMVLELTSTYPARRNFCVVLSPRYFVEKRLIYFSHLLCPSL